MESWQSYLRERFPGYLLPDSASHSLSVEEARRFLEALTGRGNALQILRAVSLLAPRVAQLATLVQHTLPALARSLASRTVTQVHRWEGGFHGRLHIARTQALHLAGQRASFVTQSRERSFDLPENLLVRALCVRLREVLVFLRTEKVLPEDGWGPGLRSAEGLLRHLLSTTALRHVSDTEITSTHVNAAAAARSSAYHDCATWWQQAWSALDDDDATVVAQIVADGALLPIAPATQFELAVMIRLAERLHGTLEELEPRAWTVERALVLGSRDEALALRRTDGRVVRIFYNQSVLPEGAVDRGARHYLASSGRMRPDLTILIEQLGTCLDAVVIECKLSSDRSYVQAGYHEAVIYAAEYSTWLRGRPKSILVASSTIVGPHREEDEVVALSWDMWPSDLLLSQLARRATI
jgi:hypothetical protein